MEAICLPGKCRRLPWHLPILRKNLKMQRFVLFKGKKHEKPAKAAKTSQNAAVNSVQLLATQAAACTKLFSQRASFPSSLSASFAFHGTWYLASMPDLEASSIKIWNMFLRDFVEKKLSFNVVLRWVGTWEYGWIRQRKMCVIQPLDVESLGVTCHYCHIRSCGRRRNAARPARHLQSPPCHRHLESANVKVHPVLRWGLFEIEQKWQQRSKVPRLIFCQFGDTNKSLVNMPSTVQSRRCYPFSPLWSATSTNAEQHSSWPNFQKKNQSQSDSFRSQIKVKGCKGQNCFMISHHFLLTSRVPCWALPTSTLRRLPNNTWIESRRALSREGGTLSKCVMWYHNSIISAKITYIPSLCPKTTNLTRKKPLWKDKNWLTYVKPMIKAALEIVGLGRQTSASDTWSFHPSSRLFHLES